MSDSLSAHIVRADSDFAAIVEAAGPFAPRPAVGDPFVSLVRAIVFQQLAGKAANAIYTRVAALFDGSITPQVVLGADTEALRGAGLSASKTAAIQDLARHCVSDMIPVNRLDELDDDDIVDRLTVVRGIGRWTAEMFLLFELRRLDVWPVDDFAVRKGYGIIHRSDTAPRPKELQGLGEIFRPYRSVAAWYCWRATDTVLP